MGQEEDTLMSETGWHRELRHKKDATLKELKTRWENTGSLWKITSI